MNELKRMWINQPSTSQPHHTLHGERVLAVFEYGETYRIYFLRGNVVSQQIATQALSEGWPNK
jgi:hypothetical protein